MEIEKLDGTGFYRVNDKYIDVFKLAADLSEQERFQYLPGVTEREHRSLILLGMCGGLV